MTDKQIIIDGTQCRYASFDGGNTQRLLCAIDDCFCDGLRTNECYYKQLKRKEQECERLNNTITNLENIRDEFSVKLDQLKAENEKYALFIEKLCDYAGLECDSEEQAMRTLSDLASQMNKARWIIDRYKQTLTEIKEIVERDKEFCIKCNGNKEIDCIDCIEGGRALLAKEILQKISECEANQ